MFFVVIMHVSGQQPRTHAFSTARATLNCYLLLVTCCWPPAAVDDAVQLKEVQPEDLVPKNAKLQRIAHCISEVADSGRLPPSFTAAPSGREQQVRWVLPCVTKPLAHFGWLVFKQVFKLCGGAFNQLAAMLLQVMQRIAQFKEAWGQQRQQQRGVPALDPPLVLKNECGVDKIVCTTLRPTCLPHVELHDIDGVVEVGEMLRGTFICAKPEKGHTACRAQQWQSCSPPDSHVGHGEFAWPQGAAGVCSLETAVYGALPAVYVGVF
jgi:hypothetical protein